MTPISLFIFDIVIALWVTTKNFVSVFFTISARRSQNLTVLESSSGASTSSRIQIGLGLAINTAKIRDKAVSVCSPPERRDIAANFFPGG